MLSLGAHSLQLYLTMFYSYQQTTFKVFVWIGFIWSFSLACASVPFVTGSTGTSIMLAPSQLYCCVDWGSRKFTPKFMAVFSSFYLLGTCVFMAIAYYQIIQAYRKQKRQKNTEFERQLCTRGIVVT